MEAIKDEFATQPREVRNLALSFQKPVLFHTQHWQSLIQVLAGKRVPESTALQALINGDLAFEDYQKLPDYLI